MDLFYDFNHGAAVPLVVVFVVRFFLAYVFDLHPVGADAVILLQHVGNSFRSRFGDTEIYIDRTEFVGITYDTDFAVRILLHKSSDVVNQRVVDVLNDCAVEFERNGGGDGLNDIDGLFLRFDNFFLDNLDFGRTVL